jgi:death-on-curing protein
MARRRPAGSRSHRSTPLWVRDDVVFAIHSRQLAEHGGQEGIRDENLLRSALARPLNMWAYGDPRPDVAALAAAYAFGIARNHAFVDGNKRTAYVVGRTFLRLNGYDIGAAPAEKYIAFLRLAEGSLDEAGLGNWIRDHLGRV